MAQFKKKNLTVDLSLHFSVTTILCILTYIKFKDFSYVLLCLAGGIFIDLDHLFDYFYHHKFKFSLRRFFDREFLKSGKVFLPFHSWEVFFLLLFLAFYLKSDGLAIFCLAMGAHLLIDYFQNPNRLFYFLIHRVKKRFNLRELNPGRYQE